MRNETDADRDYWHDVLLAGGCTPIPRWSNDPTDGIDAHETTIDDELATALLELADDMDVTLTSVVLAGHIRVLGSLSGEDEVATGYATEGGTAVPCRAPVEAESWRALLQRCRLAEQELLAHADFPVEQLRRQLELAEPAFETVIDPAGRGGDLTADTVLWIGVHPTDGRLVLRTRYRRDVLDADAAARIAGYHVTALSLITADPDSDPGPVSLLSPDELDHQLSGLAGPRRDLPDRRFHELFEEAVAAHPDAVAAVCGDEQLTYRQLNSRANQLGRALITRGLSRESVVAVVTERNLDWMAAALAVLKAGGVYLPIEPHFPADRIAAMLTRSECSLVVTEPESTATLDEALETLTGIETLLVGDAYGEGHAEDDLGVEVAPDQLAYIYFTSGSTGEPKGAMCEHGGMLNHLYAKIDDFEIGEGEVVAQIAPQCFDISLWQLVSALLVGGRTLIIDQDTILDPSRFVDRVADGEVAVMQVVPSYLEVLLTYLEQQRVELPDLHCVSVTGEALTFELAQRWFASMPDIKLANAYGLTETSDDTNHEVMSRAPDDGRIPLGPAVNNVEVRVVDEQLVPVPLGAPGEIVFSGVCVGRGYINDPERTALAFMADPLKQGRRLYRSGDFGRWRPDGKLEFLGRRDAQVKIRGFRIEIGEIENALLGIDGIRLCAVVVAERADRSKQLVAFHTGDQLDVDDMKNELGRTLPHYMVPTAFHWRQSLPLTDNGKIDKKSLRALAAELDIVDTKIQVPASSTEKTLAAAWAQVLKIAEAEIGRRDDFFDKGGTSLSAVELVIALDGAVSLKDVTRNPVLSDLALLIDGSEPAPAGLLQTLHDSDDTTSGALVCFPYAGGNAVNFQAMAKALQGSGLSVHAVELPGHDLAAGRDPFAPLDQVVDKVVQEVIRCELGPVLLWGHSSGAALAIETARKLHGRGVDVQRVFIGAQLLGEVSDRRRHRDELAKRSNIHIATALGADSGYGELAELDDERADHVGAAYRHDCLAAHEYLIAALEDPPDPRLPVPVTVVVAEDDPAVAGWADRHRDWEQLAEDVDVHALAGGGHYFLRTQPAVVARVVKRVAGLLQT